MEYDVSPSEISLNITDEMCTPTLCVNDADQHILKCSTCKLIVNYKCTRLPPYQIKRFITFGTNHYKFICENCIEVPEDLLEIFPVDAHDTFKNNENVKLREQIKWYEKEITRVQDELIPAKAQIDYQREEMKKTAGNYRRSNPNIRL